MTTTPRETPDVHDDGAGVLFAPPGAPAPKAVLPAGYTYFTDYKGNKWKCCTCMATFLTLAQRLAIKRGLIKQGFDVWQLTGTAAASAGTHAQGGAFDLLLQTSDAWVKFFRDLGATATWRRTVAQGFTKVHLHGVLNGCPHNAPARYQVVEQKSGPPAGGGDGLTGTRPDYHPDPNPYRTWSQGVHEMKRLLGDLAVTAPTSLSITPQSNIKGAYSKVAARTPTMNAGTHIYEYEASPNTWREFARATPASGASSVFWAFGGTHRVRVRFVPKDPLAAKPTTSAALQVRTYDLTALQAAAAKVPVLQQEVAALEAKATTLQGTVATLKARIVELEGQAPTPSEPVAAYGVDVSGHQTLEQVRALVADPLVDFIIVKATEGMSYTSPTYEPFASTVVAGGKLLGAYHFAWPNQQASVEAGKFVQVAGGAALQALDLERADGPEGWPERVAYALAWLRAVKAATGATPLVYVNWTWVKGLRDAATVEQWEELVGYPCWLADWTGTAGKYDPISPKAGSAKGWPVLVHQYGVVAGLDRNWVADRAALQAVLRPGSKVWGWGG